MSPWSWPRSTVPDGVQLAEDTIQFDVRACMAAGDHDVDAVRELLRLQVRFERELKAQESLRTRLLQQTEFILQSQVAWGTVESWPDDGDGGWSAATVDSSEYFQFYGYWLLQLEQDVRRVDNKIHDLKAGLRAVNRRVQTILGRCRLPRFLRGAVVVESRFYMVHGNHPPRNPGFAFWNPFNPPGVSAIA